MDIVERLRIMAPYYPDQGKAADEIERLREERNRLREERDKLKEALRSLIALTATALNGEK